MWPDGRRNRAVSPPAFFNKMKRTILKQLPLELLLVPLELLAKAIETINGE